MTEKFQAPEGGRDLRTAFESWALHTPPDDRTNWEVFQAGARAALAAQPQAPWSKTVESAALLLNRATQLPLDDCEGLAGTILGMAANVQPKGTAEPTREFLIGALLGLPPGDVFAGAFKSDAQSVAANLLQACREDSMSDRTRILIGQALHFVLSAKERA